MATEKIPFNIDLLFLSNQDISKLKQVSSLEVSEPGSKNFKSDGLFSNEIFGRPGTGVRDKSFGYIDLKLGVFHPVLYKAITDLKELYGQILTGKGYAVWDDETKDFIKSNPVDGFTGYNFFLSHFKQLKFVERESLKRTQYIKLVNKFRENPLIDKLLVLPAGLRDYELDKTGRPTEGEVNTFYRRIMTTSNLVVTSAIKTNPESLDNVRSTLQKYVNELYDYFKSLLEGKNKLVLSKWASRKIFNGTRNVATSLLDNPSELGGKQVGPNDTVIGLYQFLKGALPIALYQIRNNFLKEVFPGQNAPAILVDKQTLRSVNVDVSSDSYDMWMSEEGLEKTITKYAEEDLRHNVITIDGYYLGLIYQDDDKFILLHGIEFLPEGLDPKLVRPLTFTEVLYTAIYKVANNYPMFVTRYPITGYGSVYPSMTYLRSTIQGLKLDEYNTFMEKIGTALEFPKLGTGFYNSTSVNPKHVSRLGLDFDGDMLSNNIVYSQEAVTEVKKLLGSRKFYIGQDGKFSFSSSYDTIDFVLKNMTTVL